MLAKLPAHRKLLADAAAEMQRRGMCKFTLTTGDGRVCAMGAISAAFNGDAVFRPFPPLCQEAVNHLAKYLGQDPITYNNAYGRTEDEVIEALRNAAWCEV